MDAASPARATALALATLLALGVTGPALAGVCAGPAPHAPAPAQYLRSYYAFLAAPTRLAIDTEDNVYIADPLNGRIVVRAPDGRVRRDSDTFGYPISVAVDRTGTMYVGDGNRGRVDIYDPAGQRIGALGQGDGEFGLPGFLAFYEDSAGGHVFVVDSEADRVRRYAAGSGAFELDFGGSGSAPGELRFPSGIAIANSRVHVVDRGNSRLQIYNTAGVLETLIEPEPDNCGFLCFFGGPTRGRARDAGLWIGPGGALYLAEASKGQVLVLSAAGDALATVGVFGTAPGKLRVPSDMVIDSCGRLFVASAANGRVDIFGLPGHSDPERFVPGRLEVAGQPVDPLLDAGLVAHLELPGYRLTDVENLVANGVASPLSTAVDDVDRDNVPDLRLEFGADLLATLELGESATVTVTGTVGGLLIEESTRVELVDAEPDSDGDGVPDTADACPGTAPGATVDAEGCSVAQRCPCSAPAPATAWKNHGAYVRCVGAAARELVASGLITPRERGQTVSAAARSSCGKPRRGKR